MESQDIRSTALRLVKPGTFEKDIITNKLGENDVEIEPYMASVCHADLRYFTGNRRKKALEKKLPMALFHEGLGIVKNSLHPSFKQDDRVVVVPSIPNYVLNNMSKDECCDNCKRGGYPNYCEDGVFLGSGYDGIAQSNLVISGDNLVLIPDEIEDNIAILSELCSVSLFAINMVSDSAAFKNEKVAVFGDGPVGYLTATALHYIYNISKENLLVFGAVPEKLQMFDSFSTTALVDHFDFSLETGVQVIFECTGGKFSSGAINQAINLIDRLGTIVLMGVSEELVPINTRDILEKGLRLIGSSRSTHQEFVQLMESFKSEDYRKALGKLLPKQTDTIRNTKDLTKLMENAANHRGWEKIYLTFDWGHPIKE